jgi:hypothetical protein
MMRSLLLFAALAVATTGSVRVLGDPVLDWNAISSQAILTGGRPGPSGLLDFTVVQAAVHDAVQAYDKRFETYAVDVQNASGSVAAAVAKVTHDVLVNRFPAQAAALDTTYNDYLTDHGIAVDDGGSRLGNRLPPGLSRCERTMAAFRSLRRFSWARMSRVSGARQLRTCLARRRRSRRWRCRGWVE